MHPDDDGANQTQRMPFHRSNRWLDTHGIGNNKDTDDDGDGYLDEDEIACDSDPLDFISRPKDFDRDQLPDCTDPDDDNDGCPDTEDAFPLDPRGV